MRNIIEISDLSAPELVPFTNTSELTLMSCPEYEHGIFIAESPKVIRTALDSGYIPISLLLERKYINGQCADIIERCGNIPVYTASSQTLTELTGFKMTQGALCAMRRRALPVPASILAGAERIAVLEDVLNQTNIGAIFRSAAALGFDAAVMTPSCSDPLFRRSIRVSMGTVFQLPWTYFSSGAPNYINELHDLGFSCAAMALRNDTVDIRDPRLRSEKKLAVIFGTEGNGLKESSVAACDYTIKIPMMHGVDSLNVAAASAVAFWELSKNF
ncbi:MAG: RNA methyltransferase [Ruminococcus sp.]|uniref:TrmH family RNA methyltransferase n=1 Tax=Ruminococcus sp. TaxID=41978 RepID=UPI0025FEC550|nr:RNA methyltransferase [Ruminococcus sp.]MCR5600705.1 RNA methyltransferase [Ruminococcus sp.]